MKALITLLFVTLLGASAFANCISLEEARTLVPRVKNVMDEYNKFCQRPKIPGVGCQCQPQAEAPQIEPIPGGYRALRCVLGYDDYNKFRGYEISCSGEVKTYEEID